MRREKIKRIYRGITASRFPRIHWYPPDIVETREEHDALIAGVTDPAVVAVFPRQFETAEEWERWVNDRDE
jgi:hypothetical protein